MPKLGISYALIVLVLIVIFAYFWWTWASRANEIIPAKKESKIDIYINSINDYAKNVR
jgi:hypothetical protein